MRAGVTFIAFVTLFALDALCAGVPFIAFVTLFALDALCAGVAFIAFVTLFALDALRAGVTFVALVALQALCGNTCIGVTNPPVEVCADVGCETVCAVLTVFTGCAVFTILAILAIRAGRAATAACTDQRRKPFLLRADKAVFDRDVIGGKPHNTARCAACGVRLFNRCIKRGVGKQLLRDQLVRERRLCSLDVGKQGIVGDDYGIAASEIYGVDRAVQNAELPCQRERVVPGKIRFVRIRITERAEHQRQKCRCARIVRAKLRLRDAVGQLMPVGIAEIGVRPLRRVFKRMVKVVRKRVRLAAHDAQQHDHRLDARHFALERKVGVRHAAEQPELLQRGCHRRLVRAPHGGCVCRRRQCKHAA